MSKTIFVMLPGSCIVCNMDFAVPVEVFGDSIPAQSNSITLTSINTVGTILFDLNITLTHFDSVLIIFDALLKIMIMIKAEIIQWNY